MTKTVRSNNAPYINKALSKAIMNRSRIKNRFNKSPNDIDKHRWKQQGNYCVNLTRTAKKAYYSNLQIKNINDNVIISI